MDGFVTVPSPACLRKTSYVQYAPSNATNRCEALFHLLVSARSKHHRRELLRSGMSWKISCQIEIS